jgi:serralysin
MAVVNGTSGPDTLYGSENDIVFGFAGDDTIYGSGANVGLNGGAGNDRIVGFWTDYVDYSNDYAEGGVHGVLVNLEEGFAHDGFGATDTIRDIRHAVGTRYADTLVGADERQIGGNLTAAVDNHLYGLGGNDYLAGLAGNDELYGGDGDDILDGSSNSKYYSSYPSDADLLDGGAGFDLVSYAGAAVKVFASLFAPSSNVGSAAGDTYISIEGLIGSYGDDILVTSGSGGNQLWGGSGSDVLIALGGHNYINGGNDADSIFSSGGWNTIDGGGSYDIVRYEAAPFGVVAALDPAASPYNTGAAAGDKYVNVEGLAGSDYADVLFGDSGWNQLYGLDGNDFLIGNDGDDALYGGTGANELLGGKGNDYFNFYGSELEAGVTNQIDDFTSLTMGNEDHIYLFGVSSGDVSFVPLMTGTNVNIAVSGGIATIFVANAGLANVQAHTSFF